MARPPALYSTRGTGEVITATYELEPGGSAEAAAYRHPGGVEAGVRAAREVLA